jgi:hypothetical protein
MVGVDRSSSYSVRSLQVLPQRIERQAPTNQKVSAKLFVAIPYVSRYSACGKGARRSDANFVRCMSGMLGLQSSIDLLIAISFKAARFF